MSHSTQRISARDHMVAIAANGGPFFDAVKELGISAIELEIALDLSTPHVRQSNGQPFSVATGAGVAVLKSTLADHKVRISAILLETNFYAENSAGHIASAVRAAQVAQMLGAPAVRLDPLSRNKAMPLEQVRDRFIEVIRIILEKTAKTGVDLGIENHGPIGNDPRFLDAVFSTVDNPRLGVSLDTANFYWWGVPLEELYGVLERYAPLAKHTHVKNINYPGELATTRRPIGLDYGKYWCSLDEGNIDLRRVVQILDKAGYRRDLCIENEALGMHPAEKRMSVLKRDVEAIRRAISVST